MNDDKLKDLFKTQTKKETENEPEDILQVVGFLVGSEEFAVPILSIQEIVKPIEFTRVPGTPNYVLGVFNLRGNVFPLINLRLKFGLPEIKQNKDTRYIVIKYNDEVAGFVIDKLTEAVRIKEADIDPTPETLNEEANLIYGIGKQKDRLITILKVEYLLKRAF
ncbi:chemotaxis protein CheW [Helicobacter sp. MIT 14-3879]|uniref:chemotaxis protein CheW n=1 Tax=Helicobacter sp. MIT 14-3879 TaxID=2040649 RepID=UPI000E1F481C|nr:chemotaxis protein CheW [Helicobacter sp. MIT 14-3879]RDU64714.1 chemotaxis protein CheW [Helicobacter sp. MIT 14-3879]